MAEKLYKNIQLIHERGSQYFKHYFIPHDGNRHQPGILHPNLLRAYSVIVIAVKIFLTGFLFLSYPSPGEFASVTASQIIELTNVERKNAGLATLQSNGKLAQAAARKAQDMLDRGYFDHTGPDGSRPWTWISKAGYSYLYAGENLAKDFSSAKSTMNALMNSASHRKNILNDKYKDIGVAVVNGNFQGKDTMLMVQFFGSVVETAPVKAIAQPSNPTTQPSQPSAPPQTNQTSPPAPKPAETYIASYVTQSAESIELASGVATSIWAEFKNTGTATWRNTGDHFIAVNVTNPAGRSSPFTTKDWVEPYRPLIMKSAEVKPQQTERFEFTVQAPTKPGKYSESYALVAENLAWIDGGVFTMPITVIAPPDSKPAATTPPTKPVTKPSTPTEPATVVSNDVPTAVSPIAISFTQAATTVKNTSSTDRVISYTQIFFLALVAFLVLALLLNVFIKIRVQHVPTILRTLLVIILAVLVYATRFHFLESLGKYINIF
ncbi:MAG: CAP domain-containing protein [Patescibacteria group bacterium]